VTKVQKPSTINEAQAHLVTLTVIATLSDIHRFVVLMDSPIFPLVTLDVFKLPKPIHQNRLMNVHVSKILTRNHLHSLGQKMKLQSHHPDPVL
jgi:hypothetical protein